MKIKLFSILFLLFSSANSFSQTLEEFQKHLDLVNGLPTQLKDGKVNEAVNATHQIFAFRADLMDLLLHATIAHGIRREEPATREYISRLSAGSSKEISRLVNPLKIWDRSIHALNKDSLDLVKSSLISSLADKANIHSKPELYGLMTLRRLQEAKAITPSEQIGILKTMISNLMPGTAEVEVASRATIERRAWSRFLISYCYNELHQLSPDADLLYKAASFTPDMSDRSVDNAYFYDMASLERDKPFPQLREQYLNYLINMGKKDEAFAFLMQTALIDPTLTNRNAAKDYFTTELKNTDFGTYWKNYLNSSGAALPAIELKFADTTVNFRTAGNKWLLIDVWGTWCSPCIKELPSVQQYYSASLNETDLPEVYTLSYKSSKLPEFMSKNNYTFPVSEIDKETVQAFSIIGFPTKILITPERKSLKIPFNSDWKQIIKTYMVAD